GPVPPGITPVGGAAGSAGAAATHYAFDVSGIRVVVLDTSQGVGGDTNPATQNPQQSQLTWLAGVLGSAAGRPIVVVMNQPLVATGAGNSGDAALTTLL